MNNEMNTNVVDIEPEVEKRDLCDKILDTVIAIGEEIKAHPVRTVVTAAFGVFCYKKGKKKGYKTGWNKGTYAQYKHIRDNMEYMNDDGSVWNMIDAINQGKAESVLIFSDAQEAEYRALCAFQDEYRKNKAKASN